MDEDQPLHAAPSIAARTETDIEPQSPQTIVIRGRSVLALVIAPRWPLEGWLAALDAQTQRSANLFEQRPVVVNLAAALENDRGPEAALEALVSLAARNIKVIGVEGIDPTLLGQTRWARLPIISPGRETIREEATADSPAATAPVASLLIDRPVRSGQQVVFDQGDVTIIGAVASGAEVIAGGSIHVYGALRGRAIAGLSADSAARIFCQRFEAEMVAVDGRYRTAEHGGADLHGRPVQIRRDRDGLRFQVLE
jgi:septum site-determining protein MinC